MRDMHCKEKVLTGTNPPHCIRCGIDPYDIDDLHERSKGVVGGRRQVGMGEFNRKSSKCEHAKMHPKYSHMLAPSCTKHGHDEWDVSRHVEKLVGRWAFDYCLWEGLVLGSSRVRAVVIVNGSRL